MKINQTGISNVKRLANSAVTKGTDWLLQQPSKIISLFRKSFSKIQVYCDKSSSISKTVEAFSLEAGKCDVDSWFIKYFCLCGSYLKYFQELKTKLIGLKQLIRICLNSPIKEVQHLFKFG